MRAISVAWLAAALLVFAAGAAMAHPLAPALLELSELGGGRVAVLWKTSLLRAPGAEVAPVLPEGCRNEAQPVLSSDGDSVTANWTMACELASLVGQRVGVSGLGDARIDALVRVTLADGRVVRRVVRAAAPLLTVPVRERPLDVAAAYLRLGLEHIVAGVDHLLFVAALLLLVRGRRLLATLIAFAIGQSVTLSLALLDVMRVPVTAIDLAIAVSVFVLAVELAREPAAPPSLLRRRPWAVALAFGLLHGLAFATALREVGLPSGDVPLALFAFNLGIELGQLAFVVAVLAGAAALRRLDVAWPRWAQRIPLYTIGSLAAFWCFERAAALVR